MEFALFLRSACTFLQLSVLKFHIFVDKYKKFFKRAFRQIEAAGAEQLVLDLRDNGGGDPAPTVELLSYLLDEPFRLYRNVSAITRKFPDKRLILGNSKKLERIAALTFKKANGQYKVKGLMARLGGLVGTKTTKPSKYAFGGEVYVLVNPHSFSATGELAAILEDKERATFIGEQMGGNPNRNASGLFATLRLPNSDAKVRLPMILFETDVAFDTGGYGITPDYVVRHSVEDILQGKDAALDYTIQIIEKQDTITLLGNR